MGTSSTSGNWQIDGDEFIVLVNGEEQHSIWPSAKAIPWGWRQVGPTGPKAECLAFVEQRWTDMRPKSLQDQMKQP